MTPSPEAELRALDLFERLVAYPGNARFRERLLKRESAEVMACLARIEAGHAARAAMPTEMPDWMAGPLVEPPGRIGPFRLTERIGYGGMGDVWRGERDDGLFEQTVAIKLIHRHLSTSAAQAFEAERRILAKLDHPDIVRLTDGGATDDGLNYLIMDYVDGVPFDAAVAPLPLDQRIRLFRQAAATVQFAHSRLIAHADLKPSNILVDGEGRVRLLDFGIAGLLSGEGVAAPPTGAMTREFASPQRLAGAPPSIADDVFALGRLLALVVGQTDDEDLNAVIAKATAAEEPDRYVTVAALSADLGAWQAGLPVVARPDSWTYRARKFVRRNKTGVIASTLAIFALIGTTLFATVSAVRAERERADANRRFGEVRSMAKFMLFDLFDQMGGVPGTTAPRANLARVGQRYLSSLSADANAPIDVRIEAAEGLVRVAQIMGVSGSPNLADSGQAIRNLDQAAAMTDAMLVAEPGDTRVKFLTGKVAELRCQMKLYGDHDAKQALALTEVAERKIGTALMTGPFSEDTWRLRQCHGDSLTWLNRTKEAVPLLQAELDKALAARATKNISELSLIRNYRLLGEAHLYDSNMPAAVKALEAGYALANAVFAREGDSLRFLSALTNSSDTLAVAYSNTNRPRDALRVSKRGYEVALAAHDRDKSDISSLQRALSLSRIIAHNQSELGDYQEAAALLADTEKRWLGLIQRSPDDAAVYRKYALSMRPHGDVYRKAGNLNKACMYYRRMAEVWAKFDKRWGVSPSDKTEDVAYAAQNVAACNGIGTFHD